SGLCEPGVGCAECNPTTFVSSCVSGSVAASTECVGGEIRTVACPSGGGCIVATCEGDGDCNTANRPNNTACTRNGGAGGFCQDGSCVQCLSDDQCPDDTNECTQRDCSANSCVQVPRDGAACTLPGGAAGVCNGTACELPRVCSP